MGDIDDTKNQCAETGQIVLSLLGVLLQDATKDDLQWLGESHEVDESEHLEPVELESLVEEDELWDGANNVKEEIAGEVVHGDGLDLLQGSGPLHEVEDDLEQVDNVDGPLNVLQSFLPLVVRVSVPLLGHWVLVLIDIWEDDYERCNEHAVYGQNGNHKVPRFAEGSLCVDKIPLELWSILIDSAILVSIFINVVDHHLFQI